MGSEAPAPSLLDTLLAFFTREGWNMRPSSDQPVLTTTVDGDNGTWVAAAWLPEEDGPIVFYSHLPFDVPADCLDMVETFVSRANFGILVGNFELDLDEGTVRYKTSVGVRGVEVSDQLLRELVYVNVSTTDRYLGPMRSVVAGEVTVEEALRATGEG